MCCVFLCVVKMTAIYKRKNKKDLQIRIICKTSNMGPNNEADF